MAEANIHATLHPRLRSLSRRERDQIAEEYEPSARDLFAARHLILAGTAHVVVSRHRWARQEKQRRWAERFSDALREFSHAAHRAAVPLRTFAEQVKKLTYTGRGA